MIKKETIAHIIFTICLLYIIAPWFFEKVFLFNELIALAGLTTLAYKRFRISNDQISICVVLFIAWGIVHAFVSLLRMDAFYYYLRNLVIVYSSFAFFIGYFLFPYLKNFLRKTRSLLRVFIGIFIFIPLPRYLFERFGVAVLFPALFKKASFKWLPHTLVILNLIYGITYDAFTIIVLTAFYVLLFVSPGYKFFLGTLGIGLILFVALFIYLQPNLSLISHRYNPYTEVGIYDVIRSHRLLSLDGNNTWRLVLWKEIIVDDFPRNIFGMGFGTPALKYFPVEDVNKIPSLPYVLGSHNSYVYLFGRLGIVYLLLTVFIYLVVIREYFKHKLYYTNNNQLLVFLSFFAISIIALFNTVLESPIYASAYWLILGFTARCISERQRSMNRNEDTLHT